MTFWDLFRRKEPSPPQRVMEGRFELERDGEVAYLEYRLGGTVLELLHTQVPEKLHGQGLASSLAETALRFAREKNLKVDIICPLVQSYIAKHPEHASLILR